MGVVPLTVSMATYDDFDGVYFTIQSLRLHHRLPEGTEILVLDNHPEGPHSLALHRFARDVPQVRVIPVVDRQSSFIKYDGFTHARGDVFLGLDCHVLLAPGFIDTLMAHWQAQPHSRDLLTGPLLYNALLVSSAKMDPVWRGHDFGIWANDARMQEGVPFEIPMQGMGCFSVTRAGMVAVNRRFRGFGGEEWYVAEKVRANGGRVLCHPALGWNHRFDWPARTFPLHLADRIANYYHGWLEIYGSIDHPRIVEMTAHWSMILPPAEVSRIAHLAAAHR